MKSHKRKDKGKPSQTTGEEIGASPRKAPRFRIPLSGLPDWLILSLFCLLFLAQTVLSIREKSATFDEVVHLPAGYVYLKFGDYSYNPSHPPLLKMLGALPLLFVHVNMPTYEGPWKDYRPGHRFLYEANDADRLLFLGRLAVLPISLLLGCAVFLWTRELFGRGAAAFALLLFSFEPNILAHAPLVNNDMGAACFIFLTMYSSYRLAHRFSIPHLALAGFSLGLALVTKFSTVPLLPMLLLVGVGIIASRRPMDVFPRGRPPIPVSDRTKKSLIVLAGAIGMGILVYGTIWGAYRFRYEGVTLPGQTYLVSWDQVLTKERLATPVIRWMRDARLLPEAYLFGFSTIGPSLRRTNFYLMGRLSKEGWWYYFLVSLAVKSPLPLLLLLLALPFTLRPLWRNDPIALLCLLGPVLIYLGISSVSRLNIGHRHILPIYPFLFVMVASVVPWARRQRMLVKAGLAVLAIWYVVSSVAIFPHYLAYFNELAGGPQNGSKYLVDSNLDWGQDLKGLKQYMDEHGIERVWLSYFGMASPEYYKIAYNYLPSYVIFNPQKETQATPYTAISATNLQGIYLPLHGEKEDYFEIFKQQTPIAKIGYSIFLYRLE